MQRTPGDAEGAALLAHVEDMSTRTAQRRRDESDSAKEPGWRKYLRALGPGLVTGASDDDPSGIATYSQAGARFGYGLLWTSLLTLPLMAAAQEMCDRTALATGRGLGELAVDRFSARGRRLLVVLVGVLMVANALNIAADLVAIGAGMNLLHLGPAWMWGLIAGVVITGLLLSGSFETIARVFKLLCLVLLAYLAVLWISHPSWGNIAAQTLVPHLQFDAEYAGLVVAVLGTTISPYLFFWQSAHRVEDLRAEDSGGRAEPLRERGKKQGERKQRTSRLDVFVGMAFSNLVMFAIVVAGAQLSARGVKDIGSASQAAEALRPVAGSAASTLFAFGFIGSGMLAVPVLAGSGASGMAGLLGRRWGFSTSIRKAPVFYGLVAAGTVGGAVLSLLQVNPIQLLVVVAMINGVAAAPFLIVVLAIANNRRLMGAQRNGRASNVLVGFTTALMLAAAATLVLTGGA